MPRRYLLPMLCITACTNPQNLRTLQDLTNPGLPDWIKDRSSIDTRNETMGSIRTYVCAYVDTCMHMCIYIYVCVCVCMHTCIYVFMHASMCICIGGWMDIIYVCVYGWMDGWTDGWTDVMYACICVCHVMSCHVM